MTTGDMQFHYIFDPLCGWCYASAPALAGLVEAHGSQLQMMPSGLFATPRPVAAIADHAWRNDQRIGVLTGQVFSEDYHRNVLLAPDGIFDSTALTRALVALGQLDPALEPRFLHTAQIARYIDGIDTSKPERAAELAAAVAQESGFDLDAVQFAGRLLEDAALETATAARMRDAQAMMQALGTSGVPQLVLSVHGHRHVLSGQDLYAGTDVLLERIATVVPPRS